MVMYMIDKKKYTEMLFIPSVIINFKHRHIHTLHLLYGVDGLVRKVNLQVIGTKCHI